MNAAHIACFRWTLHHLIDKSGFLGFLFGVKASHQFRGPSADLGRWLGARTDRPALVRLTRRRRGGRRSMIPLEKTAWWQRRGILLLGSLRHRHRHRKPGHLRRTAHWQWVKHRGGLVETEQTMSVPRSPEKIQKLLFRCFHLMCSDCDNSMNSSVQGCAS